MSRRVFSINNTLCGEKKALRFQTRRPGNPAGGRSPSSGPQFPRECDEGLRCGRAAKVDPAPGAELRVAAAATPAAAGSAPSPARAQRGPDPPPPPAPRDLSPPSLPAPLAAGTHQGASCQVRRRGSRPGQTHDRASARGRPASPATTAANVSAFRAVRRRHVRKPAVRHRVKWAEVGSGGGGGRRWGGAGKEAEGGDAGRGPEPAGAPPASGCAGRAGAGRPAGARLPAPPAFPPRCPAPSAPGSGAARRAEPEGFPETPGRAGCAFVPRPTDCLGNTRPRGAGRREVLKGLTALLYISSCSASGGFCRVED